MRQVESGVLRPFCSLVRGIWNLSMFLGAFLAFVILCRHFSPDAPAANLVRDALTYPLFLIPAALVALIWVPLAWASFVESRGSYRLHATELEVRSGWLGRSLMTVTLADITKIDLSSGPLMRLLGRDDLAIRGTGACATLYGVQDGEALRALLLERRDSLREFKAEEEAAKSAPGGPVLERLARAVERLEKKL